MTTQMTKRNDQIINYTYDQAAPDKSGGASLTEEWTPIPNDDKGLLVGVPFRVLDVEFKDGNMGTFAVVKAIFPTNEKFLFTDGSTGICQQLMTMMEAGAALPIDVPGGLRRSDYTYTNPTSGAKTPATTFYLTGGKGPGDLEALRNRGRR